MSLFTMSRARRVVAAAISAVVIVGISACAADKTPKPGKTTTVVVTKTSTEDPAEPSSERTGEVDLSVPSNVTAVQSSDQATVAVETPDQLVRCQFRPAVDENGPFVLCDVVGARYIEELKKKPGWCDSYANDSMVPGFTASNGPGATTCIEQLFPTPPATTVILKDGRAARNGDLVCKSHDNQSFMTCWNTTTGSGFEITSRSYQIF